MKKFALALLLLVGGIAAALTGWSSARARQEFRAAVDRLAASPSVRILDSGYDQGWVRSRAHVDFEVRGVLGERFRAALGAVGRPDVRARLGFRSEHAIEHGLIPLWSWLRESGVGTPVVTRMQTRVELDNETQSELAPVLGRPPGLLATTEVHTSRQAAVRVRIPPAQLSPRPAKEEPDVRLAAVWQGLEGEIACDLERFACTGALDAPGLEGRGETRHLRLTGLAATFDLTLDASGVWVGRFEQRVARVSVETPAAEAPVLELRGLAGAQSNEVSGGSLRSQLDLRLDALALGTLRFGPGRLQLVVRDLDPQALGRAREAVAGAPGPGSPAAALLPLAAALAGGTPVLELTTFELETPQGVVRGSAHLRVGSGASPAAGFLLPFSGAAQIDLPAPLWDALVASEPTRAEWEREGWVAREDGRVRTRLELGAGGVRANGRPLELPGLPAPPAVADLR